MKKFLKSVFGSYTARLLYIFITAALLVATIFLGMKLDKINKQQQEEITAIRQALEQLEGYAKNQELDENGNPYIYIELEQPKQGYEGADDLADVLTIVQNQNAQTSRDLSSQITMFTIIISIITLVIPIISYTFLQKDQIKVFNDKFDALEQKMNNSIKLSVDVTEAVVNPDEEIDDIKPISDSEIDKAAALYLKSRILYANKKYEEALDNINDAIILQPKNAKYLVNRGRINESLGNIGKALEDMNKAINLDILNANSYWNRAEIFEKHGDYTNALNDMTKAINLDLDEAYYYWRRGSVYKELGYIDEALMDMKKAISKESNKAIYFLYRAYIYEDIKRYNEALADIRIAKDLEPDNLLYEHIEERIIKEIDSE